MARTVTNQPNMYLDPLAVVCSFVQGASLGPDNTMLVTEYCEGGNLCNNIAAGRVTWFRRGRKVGGVVEGRALGGRGGVISHRPYSANQRLPMFVTPASVACVGSPAQR